MMSGLELLAWLEGQGDYAKPREQALATLEKAGGNYDRAAAALAWSMARAGASGSDFFERVYFDMKLMGSALLAAKAVDKKLFAEFNASANDYLKGLGQKVSPLLLSMSKAPLEVEIMRSGVESLGVRDELAAAVEKGGPSRPKARL